MIAADTSTWIAFLGGNGGSDVELLDNGLRDRQVLMAPVVLTELLSDPKLPSEVARYLSGLPLIEVEPGYWLIAQSCLDRDVPLLTRDRDFQAFAEAAGLSLVGGSPEV